MVRPPTVPPFQSAVHDLLVKASLAPDSSNVPGKTVTPHNLTGCSLEAVVRRRRVEPFLRAILGLIELWLIRLPRFTHAASIISMAKSRRRRSRTLPFLLRHERRSRRSCCRSLRRPRYPIPCRGLFRGIWKHRFALRGRLPSVVYSENV